MTYDARSENQQGERESLKHHLLRTAELCRCYAEEFGCGDAGYWMGLAHDFGKYGKPFQKLLAGRHRYVDHALPGAAFLAAFLCGKNHPQGSPLWPLVAAVRGHHGSLTYNVNGEIQDWAKGQDRSPDGSVYSLNSQTLPDALKIWKQEIGLPAVRPVLPALPQRNTTLEQHIQKMLLTRMFFSALTDADYSASAEHFQPDYLTASSVPALDIQQACDRLDAYRKELSENSTADPRIDRIRNELFDTCVHAGASLPTGIYTLTAPTGTGKTLALLAFGLQQMLLQKKRRMILVLPRLSIIEQNAAVYRKIIPDLLEVHSQMVWDKTAARELSQRWDAPLIVTTSVAFFESLFACRGPECRKLHNLCDSVILLDEAQVLPANLLQSTLSSLRELSESFGATVVFSTATQPDFSKIPNFHWASQEILPNPQAMFLQAQRVDVQWKLDQEIPLQEIAEEMAASPNACLIVNLRSHAQKAFGMLRSLGCSSSTFLLSDDLCPAHRSAILETVRRRRRAGEKCLLVATPCIEAGVDLSFDRMYRSLAPLENIIQAAGRCNRSDARRRGQMTVFIPDEESLYPDVFSNQSASVVQNLLSQESIDINNLTHIRTYYEMLFGHGRLFEKKTLTNAIDTLNFPSVADTYHLVDNDSLHILVPFPGESALFDELLQDARKHGITANWIRRAAPLTVESYACELVHKFCECLYFLDRDGAKFGCGWYALTDQDLYNSQKGLNLRSQLNVSVQKGVS